MRQVVITKGEDSDWVAECPSLPGCISQGDTKQEAIANIKEAIELYIEALEDDHLPVPEDSFDAMLAETGQQNLWVTVSPGRAPSP